MTVLYLMNEFLAIVEYSCSAKLDLKPL